MSFFSQILLTLITDFIRFKQGTCLTWLRPSVAQSTSLYGGRHRHRRASSAAPETWRATANAIYQRTAHATANNRRNLAAAPFGVGIRRDFDWGNFQTCYSLSNNADLLRRAK